MYESLEEFVQEEMRRRGDLSARQFAELVGVSNTTINRILSDPDYIPKLNVLSGISDATGINLLSLIELCYPEIVREDNISPSARILAQQIEQLDPIMQEAIAAIVRGQNKVVE